MRWRLAAVLIVGLVAASYLNRLTQENRLRERLWGLRTALHEYIFDTHQEPQAVQDMVQRHYLREVPVDPMTGSNSTWRIVSDGGDVDVKSGSTKSALNGKRYSDW